MAAQYSCRADNSLLLDTYSTSLQRPTKPVRRAKKAAAAGRLAIFAANEICIDVFTLVSRSQPAIVTAPSFVEAEP